MTFKLCIGVNVDPSIKDDPHFVVCMPGESLPNGWCGAECSNISEAKWAVRMRFANPCDIVRYVASMDVVLGRTDSLEMQGEWEEAIIWRFSQVVDELGNDPQDAWLGVENLYGLWKRLPGAVFSDSIRGIHHGEAAVSIGAGPTAADHLPEIARNRSKLRVFCTDVMVNACLAHGFEPDYVCSIERIPGTAKVFESIPPLSHSILLCPPVIPPVCADKVKRAVFYVTGDTYSRFLMDGERRELNPGPSCGTMSINAALECGCNPVYLVGHDLCYDGERSHAESAHPETQGHAACYADPGSTWFKQSYPEVDCFGKPTTTTGLWKAFRSSIEDELILRDKTVVNVRRRSGLPIARAELAPCVPDLADELPPIVLPTIERKRIKWKSSIASVFSSAALECLNVTNEVLANTITDAAASERLTATKLFPDDCRHVANYLLQQIYNRAHFMRELGVPSKWNLYRAGRSLAMHCGKIAHMMKEWEDDHV